MSVPLSGFETLHVAIALCSFESARIDITQIHTVHVNKTHRHVHRNVRKETQEIVAASNNFIPSEITTPSPILYIRNLP
jgi:hypothetical protein